MNEQDFIDLGFHQDILGWEKDFENGQYVAVYAIPKNLDFGVELPEKNGPFRIELRPEDNSCILVSIDIVYPLGINKKMFISILEAIQNNV